MDEKQAIVAGPLSDNEFDFLRSSLLYLPPGHMGPNYQKIRALTIRLMVHEAKRRILDKPITFTDEEIAEQGYYVIKTKDILIATRNLGMNVVLIHSPVVVVNGENVETKIWRWGSLIQVGSFLNALSEKGVKTIYLYEVSRSPGDKLTKVRLAFKVGV